MSKTVNKTKRADEYWYCEDCAKKLNWVNPSFSVTVIRDLCGHCDRSDETILIPNIDFTKPDKRKDQ